MKIHVVKQGEDIDTIAYQYGMNPDTIWNDDKNSELKEKRESGNVLMPGDEIVIPDPETKEEEIVTGEKHRFRRVGTHSKLQLQFFDEEEKPRELLEIKRPKSIKETADLLGIDEWRILKSVVYMIEDEGPVGILIRGDFNINPHKVERYFKKRVRPATSEELKKFCSELFIFQRPKISAFQKFMNFFSLKPLLSKRFWLKETKIKIEEILREKEIDLAVVETLHMAEYIKSHRT